MSLKASDYFLLITHFLKCGFFPKHFHYGSEDSVKDSHIADNPEIAIRDFLKFVRENL